MMQDFTSSRWFTPLSWVITTLVVIGLLAYAFWELQSPTPAAAMPSAPTAESASLAQPAAPGAVVDVLFHPSIRRNVTLKTNIPERPRYDVVTHTVVRGDSIFAISSAYEITPESLLWANYDVLQDDPHGLRPGMKLNVPPTDGVYYQWEEGDTLEVVASEFETTVEEIVNWPGNRVDLTNPQFAPGEYVMLPGGEREFRQWIVPTTARGSSGTSSTSGSACSGGAVGSGGFVWPTANRYISGNDYYPGHLAIDLAAGEGAAVFAADSGVVTMAQGGWNYGYGNVIQIDHGNGYATLYAHLSQINVGVCQSVGAGQLIGLSGNTGNSFGAHLHFEVRLNGGFVNPWFVLP